MSNVSLEGLDDGAIRDLAATAKSLLDNPNTRTATLALAKKAHPDLSIPEIDIPNQVNGVLQKGLERLELLEKKNQEMELKNQILEKRTEMMNKYKFTPDQINEVEKLMLEKQIASHDTAAEFYKSQMQSARPTPSGYQEQVVPKIDAKDFNGSISKWARNEAAKTIDGLRSGQIQI